MPRPPSPPCPEMTSDEIRQRPALNGVRVRTVRDAEVIIHAARLGLLPIITRRLNKSERAAVQAGNVYVWEQHDADMMDLGIMKRFTDGLSWDPSRAKDGFLFYLQKDPSTSTNVRLSKEATRKGMRVRTRAPLSTLTMASTTERSLLVKKTYSATVAGEDGIPHKWHLNSYYKDTLLPSLRTIDDISLLHELDIPASLYRYQCTGTIARGCETATSSNHNLIPIDSHVGSRSPSPSGSGSASESLSGWSPASSSTSLPTASNLPSSPSMSRVVSSPTLLSPGASPELSRTNSWTPRRSRLSLGHAPSSQPVHMHRPSISHAQSRSMSEHSYLPRQPTSIFHRQTPGQLYDQPHPDRNLVPLYLLQNNLANMAVVDRTVGGHGRRDKTDEEALRMFTRPNF